jgi:hypothetical protein
VRFPAVKDPLCGLDVGTAERAGLRAIIESRGFRFTVDVQRSWNVGRASDAARYTLSVLPVEKRRWLLNEWVNTGGGTASFFASEAEAFLEFIAGYLPNPSHALTLSEVERATLRASEGADNFVPPGLSALNAPGCLLVAGRFAAMVRFWTEPRLLLAALAGQPLPPLSSEVTPVLFGPGLDGLFRVATVEENALWERLASPISLTALFREGLRRETIESLLLAGCATTSDPTASLTGSSDSVAV